ncbi:FkbM family methyltransferase [Methylobacillus sp.]|uniref:FkbM family methyltransferase n=1 Tax=Methylobacillus sp. TaxID=56818 RepID=UPI002FE0D6B0
MLSSLKQRIQSFIGHAVAQSISNSERPCAYMGDSKALTRTIYGHKMYVKTDDLSLAPHILLDGFWENWITKVFIREVQPGMAVCDIGANIGYYSLLAAAAVGDDGHLHCFEANPDVYEILFQNVEINGFLPRTKIVNKAVFSRTTKLEFNVCQKHQGSSSLFIDEKLVEVYQDNITKIHVDATSLDDYFPQGSKVDFIKVDAEGSEPDIFKGASRLLSENHNIKIMMEWAPAFLNRSDMTARDFWDILSSYGFKAFRIAHDSTLILEGYEKLSQVEHCDVLLKRSS